ncbi:MAG: hypothetical protein JJT82_06755 [Legionellaceae bacterium]|nr:hypothetical protein [Legionellaceae bacterium]
MDFYCFRHCDYYSIINGKYPCSVMLPWIMVFFLMWGSLAPVCARSINVYLAMESAEVWPVLAGMERKMRQVDGLRPVADHLLYKQFPLHVSLYLAQYPAEALPLLKQRVKAIAAKQNGFCLQSGALFVTAGQWLMWGFSQDPAHQDSLLRAQSLSDEMVLALAPLRDKKAPIPGWARKNAIKEQAFRRYGSPNVFFAFEPHVTLALPAASRRQQEQTERLIQGVAVPSRCLRIRAIGVAEANDWGQLTEVLATYPLASPLPTSPSR